MRLSECLVAGPSPRIKKWSGGGIHRVPMAREGKSTRGDSPLVRGVRGLPRKFRIFSTSMCVYNGFLCVLDQISVTIFC